MEDLEVVDEALAFVRQLNEQGDSFELLDSVIRQLSYVRGLLDGSISDRSKVQSLTLGILGAREFDGDPPLAERLLTVAALVRKQRLDESEQVVPQTKT